MTYGNLDRLLVSLNVAIEAFAICEVRRGVRLVFNSASQIEVHYVLSGTMYLEVPGAAALVCGPGCMVIVPPGVTQAISAVAKPVRDVMADDNCAMTRDGLLLYDAADGRSGDLRIVCGSIMASLSGSFGLLDQLSEPIAVDLSNTRIVRQAFATMLKEIAKPGLGTRALTGALMKSCLVMLLRSYIEGAGSRSSVLGRLRNPRVDKAVIAILDQPAASHSVASLASVAGMSRSAFAREFNATFAVTPMEFVSSTRLHHAAEILRSTTLSIKVIASSIGFASRSHFSRAFREAYGTDPRNFRSTITSPELDAPKLLRNLRARLSLQAAAS